MSVCTVASLAGIVLVISKMLIAYAGCPASILKYKMNSNINLHAVRDSHGVMYIMPYIMDGIGGLMMFMKEVVYGDALFYTEYRRSNGVLSRTISALGKHLEFLHSYSQVYSSDYVFSPLITFFFEQYRKHHIKEYAWDLDKFDPTGFSSDLFNDFIMTMRREAASAKLKTQVNDWLSKPENNMKSLIKFEDELFDRCGKVLAIRLDFDYHKATFTPEEMDQVFAEAKNRKERDLSDYLAGADISAPRPIEGRVALEQVQRDREHLFANMKGKPSLFKHLVGYVWRIEYGREAGYHLHVLFFFNGAAVERHEYLAQEIGCYYRDVITQGRSYFENCNRKKSKYGDAWALGQIDHWDLTKRGNLLQAMQYFCKTNQLVQVVPYQGCHLFGCGFTHRQGKGKGGRPRTRGVGEGVYQRPAC